MWQCTLNKLTCKVSKLYSIRLLCNLYSCLKELFLSSGKGSEIFGQIRKQIELPCPNQTIRM